MIQRVCKYISVVVSIILIAGCMSSNLDSTGSSDFGLSAQESVSPVRHLNPGDGVEVSIEVDGIMEVMSHRAEIDPQGVVTLPLIGDVDIGGLKLSDARDKITGIYKTYYVNPPVVMLTLVGDDLDGEWGFVTVLGRVEQPGRVPLPSREGINLSAAIQRAGGFAPSAKTGGIRITRTDELGMKTRVSVDFEEIGQAGNAEADLILFDGDIIYVPERFF